MLKLEEIAIGYTYLAKVSGKSMEVRIDRALPKGGWDATNLGTNKTVRIKNVRDISGPAVQVGDITASVEEDDTPAEIEAVEPTEAVDPPTVDPDLVPISRLDREKKSAGKPKRTMPVKEAKAPPAPKAVKEPKPEKAMSCLDAAATVLKAGGEPMACKAMIDAMHREKLWTSDAPTPSATLYSAILREITKKASASRFKKTERGQFALNA